MSKKKNKKANLSKKKSEQANNTDKNGFEIKDSVLIKYHGNGGAVVIPKGVTSIGRLAFGCYNSLISVTIPDSVTSIGDFAFQECSSLTSVTIPDSVTSMGDGAFAYCESLTSVTIPNGLTSIGESAFLCCESLTSVTIPDSVTSIEEGTFKYCSNLTSVTIPDSVTNIGEGAFWGCSNLTSVICNSQEVMNRFSEIFDDCPIQEITISDNINTVDEYDFSEIQIHFSEHHKTGVLYNTSGTLVRFSDKLNTVTISENVAYTDFDTNVFLNCHNLKNVIFPLELFKKMDEWDIDDFFSAAENISNIIIKIPEEMTCIKKHTITEDAIHWGEHGADICLLLPDGVKRIEEDAFFLGYRDTSNKEWMFWAFIEKIFWRGAEFDFHDCLVEDMPSESDKPERPLNMDFYEYYDIYEKWLEESIKQAKEGFYSVLNCLFAGKYDELPAPLKEGLISILCKNPTDEKLLRYIINRFEDGDIDYNDDHFFELLEVLIDNHQEALQKFLGFYDDFDVECFLEAMLEKSEDEAINKEKIVQAMLDMCLITKDNIDKLIQFAIDNKTYEIQLMLTNYKVKNNWYDDQETIIRKKFSL